MTFVEHDIFLWKQTFGYLFYNKTALATPDPSISKIKVRKNQEMLKVVRISLQFLTLVMQFELPQTT